MAGSSSTLDSIAVQMGLIFLPLKERLVAGQVTILFAELGLRFPAELEADTVFMTAISNTGLEVAKLPAEFTGLVKAIADEDNGKILEHSLELLAIITRVGENIDTIATHLEDNSGSFGVIDSGDVVAFAGSLARKIVDYLVVSYLDEYFPVVGASLEFLGIVKLTETPVVGGVVGEKYYLHEMDYNNFVDFFKSPKDLLEDLYGWGTNTFDADLFLERLYKVMYHSGVPVILDKDSVPTTLDFVFAELSPLISANPTALLLTLKGKIDGDTDYTFSKDRWDLTVGVGGSIDSSVGVIFHPGGKIEFGDLQAALEGKISIKWTAKPRDPAEKIMIFGDINSSHLATKNFSIGAEVGVTYDIDENKADGVLAIEAELTEGELVIKPGNPDGFLAKILPPDGFRIDFSLLVGISTDKGVYFKGSGTLEFDIPVSIPLGPISILNLTLGISPSPLTITLGGDIKAELGPFTATVENLGLKGIFTFPDDRKGNLGPANLDIGFKPPNGVALTLDAGVVKGGGYLMLDYDKGEYAGAVELEFEGLFGFTAIGLINTKFPDGSSGFSMLLLINVTFGTPIALGFNFYLAGIGGIIGLHRSMNTQALQAGVKDGSVSNILFPENVIANITKIISDIKAIFPMKQDQFVLGLMARITWNTPAILTIEAGLVIEFPNPVKIAIIGVVRCQLPDPEKAILQLNVAFIGIIDFEKKLLSFDASIFNSRILTITLEGDIALRISWGDKPDFLVSIGGFHPAYSPPAHLELLPMKRLTVSILSGNPNLVLTAYFALTSNTIQFGAALDFSFRISKFGIYGFLGFDVLIQFSPFRFMAGITASVEVRWGSTVLFSIGLSFNLEGPADWRAHGYAKFKILFISFKIKFDKTWGEKKENSLPGTDVLPMLLEQLNKNENWTTTESAVLSELVELAKDVEAGEAVIVKPFGSLQVDQTVVPLDLSMEKFGNYKPEDISKASITSVSIGTDTFLDSSTKNLKNSFAPAAYKKMDDEDKLSSPSYENQNSGKRVTTTDDRVWEYGINRLVQYETIISDFEEEKLEDLTSVKQDFFKPFVKGGDIGKSHLSKLMKQDAILIDKKVNVLANEQYAVVSSSTLKNAHSTSVVFSNKSDADEYLRATINSDPSMKGKIQLSPAFAVMPD